MATTVSLRSSSASISALAPSPNTRTTTMAGSGTSTAPATPLANAPSPSVTSQPLPPTPGAWRHPREDEIILRLNRTIFDKSNVFTILRNALFLIASFGLHSILHSIIPASTLQSIGSVPTYLLLALRLTLLLNIGLALRPLLRTPDACEDIPLTPSQRHLFGLPPLARPATPQEKEQYVTPPRYSSGTPRSSSSSLYAEVSGSPLDLTDRRASFTGSTPFRSPSGSPLGTLQPHRGGSGERRKLSYTANRSSPLSISEFDAAGSVNTPTKMAGHRASVGLNSKWLYEKGKTNGSARATGSVIS